jgi:hypothetical protein
MQKNCPELAFSGVVNGHPISPAPHESVPMPQLVGFLRGSRISHWAVMVQKNFWDLLIMRWLWASLTRFLRGITEAIRIIIRASGSVEQIHCLSFLFFYSSSMTPLSCSSIIFYGYIFSSPDFGK